MIDNYDSFTYNLAQYIGNFAEVTVLRNDDAGLYQAAEEADALVLSPGPGWQQMQDGWRRSSVILLVKRYWGFAWDTKPLQKYLRKASLAPKVMHGKQSILRFEGKSPIYQGIEDGQRSCAIIRF